MDVDVDSLKDSEGFEDDDPDPPLSVHEQHCFLDLDEDGYQEPYTVTYHKDTREILRKIR